MSYDILLCDDEVHIIRAAEFKLVAAGHRVRRARNGREAWQRIEEQLPDLLVTDLQMPEMNGCELIQCVRKNAATTELPIILLTAKALEIAEGEAVRFGLIRILTKPFSPKALLQLIEATLSAPAERAASAH
jgi:two-component system, OmpR family, alkaline phosphatase synthesis response regulator PhoP